MFAKSFLCWDTVLAHHEAVSDLVMRRSGLGIRTAPRRLMSSFGLLFFFDLLDQLHGVLVDFLPVALVVGEVEIRRRVHGTQSRVFNRLAHRGS